MKFINIDIKNFLAIGDASLKLDDRGLLLIQGDNRDDSSQNSNGAGKSSIVDALCWGLFGQTAREESGDAVINRTAKKNCRVTIEIADGEDKYTVIRHRKFTKKRNVLEVFRNTKEDLTKGTDKLTQEVVDGIIGCSYDVFRASIYAGQERQVDLPNMTDKFLKQIVEEAAGIDRLQNAHALAKEKTNEIKSEASAIESKLTFGEMSVEQEQIEIDQAEEEAKKFEAARQTDIDKFEFRIKNAKKKAGAIVAQVKAIDITALESDLESLSDTSASDAWHKEHTTHGKLEADTSFKLSAAKSDLSKKATAAKAAKANLDNVEDEIGKPCSECGTPYTEEDIEPRRLKLRDKLTQAMTEVREAKNHLEAAQKAHEAAAHALEAHKATKVNDESGKARREALTESIDEYKGLLSDARVAKTDIQRDIESLSEKKAAENGHFNTVKRLKDKLVKTQEQIKSLTDKMSKLKSEQLISEGVAEVFGNSGVRAHILDTVTPYLNSRTSEYLGQLSDGNLQATWNTLSQNAKGELREQFHIHVSSLTGGESYKQLSGGEKRKVRLATNMALQDLVSSRASKPIDLYIGDEIDNALDVSGLERLMGVLEERAKHHGTVLVISHNELSDWIRESITVVKQDGYTTIEE